MVASSITGLVFAFTLLSHTSVAVPILADQNAYVRRQDSQVEVSLNPKGEVIEEAHRETPKHASMMQAHDDTDLAPEDLAKSGLEIGRFDFVLGVPDTDGCNGAGHEKINEASLNSTGHIIGLSLCMAAADVTGAHFTPFTAGDGQEGNHPKGCFKADCTLFDSTTASHPACFFYNGMGGDTFPNVTGTPVCSRAAFVYGTDDVQGCKAEHSDYQVMDAEETCRTAAGILGTHPVAAEFRVGVHNASKHLDYVQGCFLNVDRSKVYYNAKSALGDGVAGHMKGRNMCNVTAPLQFPSA